MYIYIYIYIYIFVFIFIFIFIYNKETNLETNGKLQGITNKKLDLLLK